MKKSALEKKVKSILKRPYHRVFIPEDKDGGYTALIQEFPGCISCGDTLEEANKMILDAAEGWVEACLERGLKIPEPISWGLEKERQVVEFEKRGDIVFFYNVGKINKMFVFEVISSVKKFEEMKQIIYKMFESIGVCVHIKNIQKKCTYKQMQRCSDCYDRNCPL